MVDAGAVDDALAVLAGAGQPASVIGAVVDGGPGVRFT